MSKCFQCNYLCSQFYKAAIVKPISKQFLLQAEIRAVCAFCLGLRTTAHLAGAVMNSHCHCNQMPGSSIKRVHMQNITHSPIIRATEWERSHDPLASPHRINMTNSETPQLDKDPCSFSIPHPITCSEMWVHFRLGLL
jgi:hypothetical protein